MRYNEPGLLCMKTPFYYFMNNIFTLISYLIYNTVIEIALKKKVNKQKKKPADWYADCWKKFCQIDAYNFWDSQSNLKTQDRSVKFKILALNPPALRYHGTAADPKNRDVLSFDLFESSFRIFCYDFLCRCIWNLPEFGLLFLPQRRFWCW